MNPIPRRIAELHIIVALIFIGIMVRLFWLQVYRHQDFEARAALQQTTKKVLPARRGDILVREKDRTFPIAMTQEGWLLAIDPRNIENPTTVYKFLKQFPQVTISEEEFLYRATKKDDPYEVVAHRLSYAEKKQIEDAHFKGIMFSLENWRSYPAGDFASHILGYIGVDAIGKYGIERQYHDDLVGEDGLMITEEAPSGRFLLFGDTVLQPQKDGSSLLLTIDAGAQNYLEKTLMDLEGMYHTRGVGGIIIDPRTGKILAMAARPSYDPNTYSKEKDIGVFRNPFIENLFEMGSVVKPLTMAAALDAGVVTTETTYEDTGSRMIDGSTIENYDGKARGVVPMQEILSQSLNLGATFLMEQLGKDRFRQYMHAYGLAEETHIDLPNESKGNLRNLESTRTIEYATAAFGQGISVTPLELVRALSSIANGGVLVRPYIVEEIRYDAHNVVLHTESEKTRVLKEDTAKTVTRMLVRVVDEKLANGKGRIPGYSIAAKTGTAQIASATARGYSGDFMHTFFGYGPAFDPKFLVLYYLDRPQGIKYASESLTEPFRNTMKFLFSYYEIPPDRPQEENNQ